MVRQVAGKAPESEFDRCISEGVDLLERVSRPRANLPVKKALSFLKSRSLFLLTADKEGGFAVLPKQLFDTKASAAVSTVFSKFPEVDLKKVKSRAIKLCSQFKLEALKKSISEGSKLSLDLFFSAKTHKPDCPLRVIVSESNTWQKQLASFLQEKLRILPINDPFRVKNSEEVIHFLTEHSHQGHLAFSIDIKDLYYSIPHDDLMTSVSECLDRHGATKFQNESGIHCSQFLELISMYLKSTFAEWNGDIYLQKNGICIGSCIAPILSDLYLAVRDKKLKERLDYQKVVRVFRYVDDFLVLLCYDEEGFDNAMCSTIEVFTECLRPLVITHEVPKNNFIRFLDLGLYCSADHVCWSYEPRGSKPVLPYHSAHSKLVKRAIARSCFHHALVKSCIHRCETSFLIQTHRLRESGYPMALLASVAEVLLKGSRSGSAAASGGNDARFRPEKVLVIPYVHTVSHNLRKLGRKVGLDVLFSAPVRLSALCKKANSQSKQREACSIKHRNPYVTCTECVVYSIPLTCDKVYVGQTGRCLNTRLTEHSYHCSKKDAGHLAIHCRDCGCAPMLGNTRVVCREKGKIAREILEAAEILERREDCISCPSVALSSKERKFLGINT